MQLRDHSELDTVWIMEHLSGNYSVIGLCLTFSSMPPDFVLFNVVPLLGVLAVALWSSTHNSPFLSHERTISRDGFPLLLAGASKCQKISVEDQSWIYIPWFMFFLIPKILKRNIEFPVKKDKQLTHGLIKNSADANMDVTITLIGMK